MEESANPPQFEAIYNPDGTCHQWDCGQTGVVLAYDDFSPEVALWFCAECWQPYEVADVALLEIVEDKRIRNEASMNWTSLPAEQRDTLIAEKVMGWKPAPCDSDLLEGCGFWRCSRCGLEGDWEHFDDYSDHMALPPHYSTDMNAAWEVLQHIVNQYCVDYPKHSDEWDRFTDANYAGYASSGNIYRWVAMWTPERICKAALIAVGVELV